MDVHDVSFHSLGSRVAGTLRLPEGAEAPFAAIVQGPGWLGLRGAKLYHPYHDALLAAGFAVLVFDYRGFGDSEGSALYLDPMDQVADIRAAVTYLQTRQDIDSGRIGVFGSGGTGGGNAIYAAGLDTRIKATVAQVAIADGRDWLHRMRREHEWLDFLAAVRADSQQRVLTGKGELVAPREGIMVPTPERRKTTIKKDVDDRVPKEVELASAEAIMAYRPIDVVDRIAPRALMIICVENDATTPEDHSFALYERAGEPKRLVVQTGTSHYAAYERYRDVVNPMIVEWFEDHLDSGDVHVHEQSGTSRIRYISHPATAGGEGR
jgi:dipeptidyl aminopeptidase/acylaminoacyl peptidase